MPKKAPPPVHHFPYTLRIQAFELATQHRLHLVRDNFHLWAIRSKDNVQIHITSARSYDGLWLNACKVMRADDFDPLNMPYRVDMEEGSSDTITLYNPLAKKLETVLKKDLRNHSKE